MPSLLLASGHRANEFQRRRRREDREMRNGDDGPRPRRGRTMSAPRARRRSGPVAVVRVVLLLLLLLLQIDASAAAGAGGGSDDPYVVLGVRRTASNEEIQRAYRQRAKETHPDKNPSPDAADQFRRVTDAFDILGDPAARRRHDARRDEEAARRKRRRREQERKEKEKRRREEREEKERRRREKERAREHKEKVKRARAARGTVLRPSDLREFGEAMLDPARGTYETHVLIMFVANWKAERRGEEELLFPYPFAGGEGPYGGMLRTAKVRFNAQTELTRLFRAKSGSNVPHVVFARQGDAVRNFQVFRYNERPGAYSPDVHDEFKRWVESLLVIRARVANAHSLPVEYFVLRDGGIVHRGSLDPDYQDALTLRVRDCVVAFDKRLDAFPGGKRNDDAIPNARGALLMDEVVVSGDTYIVERKRCYDLSVECRGWTRTSRGRNTMQCQWQPEFMHHVCPHTCGVCSENLASDLVYVAMHRPLHRFPSLLRGAVRSGRHLLDDVGNMLDLRKNAAFVFFAVGLLVPFNLLAFRSDWISSAWIEQTSKDPNVALLLLLDATLMLLSLAVCAATAWMVFTPAREIPYWLRGFHRDLTGVAGYPDIFTVLLVIGVIASAYFNELLNSLNKGKLNSDELLFFATVLLALAGSIATALSFKMSSDMEQAIRWQNLWNYRKNATFFVVLVGICGGAALVSLKRMLKPLRKHIFLVLLSNLILTAVVSGVASLDRHFKEDLMHIIDLRKNAAFAFAACGALSGNFVAQFLFE